MTVGVASIQTTSLLGGPLVAELLLHGGPSLRWGALTYVLAPLIGLVHGFTAAALTLPVRDNLSNGRESGESVDPRTHLVRGSVLGLVNLVLVVGLWGIVPHELLDAARTVGATLPWVLVQLLAAIPLCLGYALWQSRDEPSPSAILRATRTSAPVGGGLVLLVTVAALTSL